MRKMKGSSNYLKNQVRANLAKAILCLVLFGLVFSALTFRFFLTLSFDVFEIIGFLFSLAPLVAFFYYERKYRIYGGGLAGEKKVTQLLGSKLSDDYVLINGLYLRNGGGDIDHVVLSPSGVFVIETKNWAGNISCNGDYWERAGRRSFNVSPSQQVKRNVARLRRVIESSPALRALNISVEGIVVFSNNRANLRLSSPTVSILRLTQLVDYITGYVSSSNLSRQQLDVIGNDILKQRS